MFIKEILLNTNNNPEGISFVEYVLALLFEGCLLKPLAEDPDTLKFSNISSLGAVPATYALLHTCKGNAHLPHSYQERTKHFERIREEYHYQLKEYNELAEYLKRCYRIFRETENDYALFGILPPNLRKLILDKGIHVNEYAHLYWTDEVKNKLYNNPMYDLLLKRTFEATLYN